MAAVAGVLVAAAAVASGCCLAAVAVSRLVISLAGVRLLSLALSLASLPVALALPLESGGCRFLPFACPLITAVLLH